MEGHAHQLPMAADGIFSGRLGLHFSKGARGGFFGRYAQNGLDVPQAEGFHVRDVQPAHGAGRVGQRIAAAVPIQFGVGGLTGAHAV